jgi:hypothetical protein
VPDAVAVVVGFWAVEVKPPGPVQLYVAEVQGEARVAVKLIVAPAQYVPPPPAVRLGGADATTETLAKQA